MAENSRVRIEPHVEVYLKSHSERILDKPSDSKFTVAELGIIANHLLMEHKQATKWMNTIAQKIPLANLFNWLTNLGSNNSKVVQIAPSETPALPATDNSFDVADFSDQFDKVA